MSRRPGEPTPADRRWSIAFVLALVATAAAVLGDVLLLVAVDWGVVPLAYGFLVAVVAVVMASVRLVGRRDRAALLLAALVISNGVLLAAYALLSIPS